MSQNRFINGMGRTKLRGMLIISNIEDAPKVAADVCPSKIVTLVCEDEPTPVFAGYGPDDHLVLYVEDESDSSKLHDGAKTRAEKLVEFAGSWDGKGDILVHCNRGVSRSTAAAFIISCVRQPQTDEAELIKRMRDVAPHADPCMLLVHYADEILDRHGRMLDAVADLEPPSPAIAAPTVSIPIAA
ncbi:MAG: hypothetical protein AAF668_10740 [Pseudomonadota bacterium]